VMTIRCSSGSFDAKLGAITCYLTKSGDELSLKT